MKRVTVRMRVLVLASCLAGAAAAHAQDGGAAPLRVVRANGVELHYVEFGSGVPVVFVPGGLEDYRAWAPQAEAFSHGYRAIAYSRRYNYPNAPAAADPRYSAVVDADDLAALIAALELPPAHVVGLSYGAYGALLLAARHPALVRSLVLSEPPVMPWLPGLPGGKPLYDEFMNVVWKPTGRAFREGDRQGVSAAVAGFGALGYEIGGEKPTFETLPPEVQEYLLQNAPEWRALTASTDPFPALSYAAVQGIRAPVLMLSGERTLALQKALDAQLEKLLRDHERLILPNATHEMWSEYPEACRKAALAFLARH